VYYLKKKNLRLHHIFLLAAEDPERPGHREAEAPGERASGLTAACAASVVGEQSVSSGWGDMGLRLISDSSTRAARRCVGMYWPIDWSHYSHFAPVCRPSRRIFLNVIMRGDSVHLFRLCRKEQSLPGWSVPAVFTTRVASGPGCGHTVLPEPALISIHSVTPFALIFHFTGWSCSHSQC
jgi:hypothetical protein